MPGLFDVKLPEQFNAFQDELMGTRRRRESEYTGVIPFADGERISMFLMFDAPDRDGGSLACGSVLKHVLCLGMWSCKSSFTDRCVAEI